MASFTGVGDNVELQTYEKGDTAAVAISGTYDMTIKLQRELGSPGSGAWEDIKSWNTANATVAYNYTTVEDNETLRLVVSVDTSGTATATLTDTGDRIIQEVKDTIGNVLMRFRQTGVEIAGSVRRISNTPGGDPVPDALTASTSLTAKSHAGKIIRLSAAAGLTITLPAAAGTGNVYTMVVVTTVTSNDYIIQVANATDTFYGGVSISTDIAGVSELAVAGDDTITMNGSTTGGLIGSWVRCTDVVAGGWMLEGFLCSTGTEATCFSAAVS